MVEADSNQLRQKMITLEGYMLIIYYIYISLLIQGLLSLLLRDDKVDIILFTNTKYIYLAINSNSGKNKHPLNTQVSKNSHYLRLIILILQSTMNTFGVSVFNEPQEMIALYLGMNSRTYKFLGYVQKLLQRTKSPPIAITYTYHFLKDKTEEELSLDVIRFISQLADISQGISMSTSLHGILTESSFLTELRHSLTHKTMVKGSILLLSKTMIIEELQNKFWKSTIEKLRQTYCLSKAKVNDYYRSIYDEDYLLDLSWLNLKLNVQSFKACSNYEYKEHIGQVITQFKLNNIQSGEFLKYYEEVSQQKQIIFIIILFQQYLQSQQISNQHFATFAIRFIKIVNIEHFSAELVLRQCQKSYFLKFIPHSKAFFDNLPEEVQAKVKQFWRKKEQIVGKLYKTL